jgi:cytoskeletal protein CcmA (bactofilin family)
MKKSDKDIQMLGPQVAIEGSLVFEGTLFMNGHIKGTVESGTGTIVIGEGAVIHADVFVKYANVSGEVKGTIRAAELIKLHASARVEGAVNAPRIQIDPGAIIDGRCTTGPMQEDSRPADRKPEKKAPQVQTESQKPAASIQ